MPTNFPNSLDSFVNPTGADRLNGDPNPAVLHHVQHSNINDAMSAVETKLGIDFSTDPNSVDYILRKLEAASGNHPLGGYKETTYVSNVFPSVVTWYTDSSKTITLLQKQLSYGPGNTRFITQIVVRLYDGTSSNVLKKTVTDVIT